MTNKELERCSRLVIIKEQNYEESIFYQTSWERIKIKIRPQIGEDMGKEALISNTHECKLALSNFVTIQIFKYAQSLT